MNRPLRDAIEWHEGKKNTLKQAIDWHFERGYVYSGVDVFILARPVFSGDVEDIMRPWVDQDPECVDCWFVWFASGRGAIFRFMELAPFRLPFVGWHRYDDRPPKFFEWARVQRKVKHGNFSRCTTRSGLLLGKR
jgi:hypothetical protein